MHDSAEYHDEADDPLEAYCVRCRETIEMDNPKPVWTRRGMPATRGECPDCSGTVFRMGRSPAHLREQRPAAVQVESATSKRAKLSRDTAYLAFSEADSAIAEQLADDLQKAGIAVWLHDPTTEDVHWAAGVHPALTECTRMVVVVSGFPASSVTTAWTFFKSKSKRIVVAQVEAVEVPDGLRRAPRFDLTADYKSAFRQLVQALSG
jgi:DNA-directed RNA polymerase subunit RPC12/RpoP